MDPRVSMFSTSRTSFAGSTPGAINPSSERFGSALENTWAAVIVDPSASRTPVATPRSTMTSSTGDEVRIVAPWARAAAASASLMAPMPPRASPNCPKLPLNSPQE